MTSNAPRAQQVGRHSATGGQKSKRDPRLDFWRGLAMLIIMIAHIQWNAWGQWIPARFGPSDAAEMFVFSSGYAAAIAFGGTFARHGFWMGFARILFRCWQIYWAHLGLFFTIATISVAATFTPNPLDKNYLAGLNLEYFFNNTTEALLGLFTLTYVPNYFDILPMYMVILLMTPLVIVLQRIHLYAAIGFCVALYAAAFILELNLPAHPSVPERGWYFNPLSWQLLFFTAFMISRGWIPVPPFKRWILLLAAGYIVLMIPLNWWRIYENVQLFDDLRMLFWEPGWKTYEHPVRYIHILAITYLAIWAIRGREQRLLDWPWRLVVKVGQQALPTFMTSMALAWILSIVLDHLQRSALEVALANIFGMATLIIVAYVVDWYKREPWRQRPQATQPASVAGRPHAQPAE